MWRRWATATAKAGRRRDGEALVRELVDRHERGYVSPASIAVLTVGLRLGESRLIVCQAPQTRASGRAARRLA
jgi:hypothetical protein